MATPAPAAPKQSFLETLTKTVYLDYVLKAAGVIVAGVALVNGWHSLGFLAKTGLIVGPVMWYVGARFDKLYR
jgi:hypothetical protein